MTLKHRLKRLERPQGAPVAAAVWTPDGWRDLRGRPIPAPDLNQRPTLKVYAGFRPWEV